MATAPTKFMVIAIILILFLAAGVFFASRLGNPWYAIVQIAFFALAVAVVSRQLWECFQSLEAAGSKAQAVDVAELKALLQEVIALPERRPALTERGYARRVQENETRLDAWLFIGRRRRCPRVERLVQHLCAHRGEWPVCLYEPEVPTTNNHAEQRLRPAVISRKVGGCNKTESGPETHSILGSILVTAKRLGHEFLELATGWLPKGQADPCPLEPETTSVAFTSPIPSNQAVLRSLSIP